MTQKDLIRETNNNVWDLSHRIGELVEVTNKTTDFTKSLQKVNYLAFGVVVDLYEYALELRKLSYDQLKSPNDQTNGRKLFKHINNMKEIHDGILEVEKVMNEELGIPIQSRKQERETRKH